MKEKQSKKIFTRMLMNNWGGISHKVMEFHEYVNLFSGKSGSGKSTVMDAIQVVLYGSISSTFLNKAADDAKNRRSVLSYLRGAQKDGSFNRENQDFCSQIVLEIKDTGKNTHTCIGVAFEVGKADTDIRKYAEQKKADWILNGGIEKEWDFYLKKMEQYGLSDYISIKQKYFDEYQKSLSEEK